ncbi:ABC transporter permease [Haloarcula sp. S1CR25-12]|uniref:ABC transporter permease n=1 Tax=Haloarcula saliterrae TaxID=2950534 RepID=A0ABU2FHC6_9EURY|nr:ABC transporter permease [Haloarcula sp. S1CR25-12]MDS0261141.1 ABC transporter permease [Haloarcula sp. S1CR25-12]
MSTKTTWSPEWVDDGIENALAFLRANKRLQLPLFIGPIILFTFFGLIVPVAYMVAISFMSGLPPGAEFTLENYQRFLATDVYLNIGIDTIVLTVQTTSLVVVLGYLLAYGIAMFAKRQKLLLLLVILPFWTNYLVRNFALIAIFQNGGPFDQLVDNVLFFVDSASIGGDILFTRTSVLMGLVYSFLPVAVLPMYASISRMDKSLISASKDLGAGPIKTFVYVTLPQTKDGIFVGTLLAAVPTFGAFVTPAMLGGPNDTMIGRLIELQYMQVYDVPFGSALGTVLSLFVIVVLGISFMNNGVPIIDNE